MEKDIVSVNNHRQKKNRDESLKGQVDFTTNKQYKELFKN